MPDESTSATIPGYEHWNPRFVRYAFAHGREPESQIEHDRTHWEGGCMLGFILWNTNEWRVFGVDTNRPRGWENFKFSDVHRDYDAWLAARYPTPSQCESCGPCRGEW